MALVISGCTADPGTGDEAPTGSYLTIYSVGTPAQDAISLSVNGTREAVPLLAEALDDALEEGHASVSDADASTRSEDYLDAQSREQRARGWNDGPAAGQVLWRAEGLSVVVSVD